ncbi:hypothetical protein GGI07_001527 [Coemansia sp. Benny D115]|nr:hypothetical protein GGI07_001527 [Coemansia sp. Benny D115]
MRFALLLYLAESALAISAVSHAAEATDSGNAPESSVQKCTWDGTQVLDDTHWDPAKSYQYNQYSGPVVGPGAIDQDITDMLKKMTVEEKVGQMTQIEVGQLVDCNGKLNTTAVEYWIDKWKVGSFLETPGNHNGYYSWYSAKKFADFTDAVQKIALKKGSKIPVIWGLDSVRGANYVKGATIFPAGTSTAATFDPKFAYDAGRIAAKDTRAAGAHWAFAPILDIAVNKLWARTYENFGEDPYLSSQMAKSSIQGYQGDYKHDRSRVAACFKHFIGYGYPFDGRDRANRHIAANELLEFYVPPFKAAIDAGAASGMESYGTINGESVVLSNYYLKKLLRKQLGFKGMLVTDWAEINSQVDTYHTAKDQAQAVRIALLSTSNDMSMVADDESFTRIATEVVKNGTIPVSRLDESVGRILQLKKDLGLFEAPFADRRLANTVGSAQDVEAARNAVRESVTLLKNDNKMLPLKRHDKVLFVGPTLNSTRYMAGGWNVHWQGPSDKEGDSVYQGFGDTVLEGIERVTGSKPKYMPGVDIDGESLIDISGVIRAAKKADKVVIGLGEHTYAELLGDIPSLALPANHIQLVQTIAKAAKKPIAVVLIQGRPRGLGNIPEVADAIVNAYLPGAYGGLPIAEILYGKVNPSGRLPITYPANEAQASYTIWQPSYPAYDPQWAFGFGLGYSEIAYSNFAVSNTTLSPGFPVTVSVSVTNRGSYAQRETVMAFTHQQYRLSYAPEHYRLRAFTKVDLAAGETKTVSLSIAAEDIAFWDRDLNRRIEIGTLNIAINPYTQKNIVSAVELSAGSLHVLETGEK